MSATPEGFDEIAHLRDRLRLAERVCLLFGWSAARSESEMDKATTQAWMEWHDLAPEEFTDPKSHPGIRREITRLAKRRDKIRSETLSRYFGPEGEDR